jgi:hypothetical protein
VQLADVVGDGHQAPFSVDILQPPQQEAIQSPRSLDLTKVPGVNYIGGRAYLIVAVHQRPVRR